MFLSDSFVMPANAKHPDATTAWLTVAASKAGQEAFNPVKGSICARTDCDQSLFNEYLQSAGKDWSTRHGRRQPDARRGGERCLEGEDRYGAGPVPGRSRPRLPTSRPRSWTACTSDGACK